MANKAVASAYLLPLISNELHLSRDNRPGAEFIVSHIRTDFSQLFAGSMK